MGCLLTFWKFPAFFILIGYSYLNNIDYWLLMNDITRRQPFAFRSPSNFYFFSGVGRCGNGTLNIQSLGTATKVTGMTYLDEKEMWIFSGSFVSIFTLLLKQLNSIHMQYHY